MRGLRGEVQNRQNDKGTPTKEKEGGTGGVAGGNRPGAGDDLQYAIRLLDRIAYQTGNQRLEFKEYLEKVVNGK